MSNNVTTCDFMDEAPGHDATEHQPHNALPDYGRRVEYADGDILRYGYSCHTCVHATDESGRFHTDPRLDVA